MRAGQERAGLWSAGSRLRPGRWCRLLTVSLPAGRRCQWCSCSRCRCMSACARQHCERISERARTMRAWAAQLLHPTGPRGCRNYLAGSPLCRAEAGERSQAAKKLVSTFSEQFLPSTFRVIESARAVIRHQSIKLEEQLTFYSNSPTPYRRDRDTL